jgi:hypothetical protein
MDWYVAPLADGPVVKTGVREALLAQEVCEGPSSWPPQGWSGQGVLFAAGCGGVRNLWHIDIDPASWKPLGQAVRVTFGTGSESYAAVASSGEIAFASFSRNQDLWRILIDANQGRALGAPSRLTSSAAPDGYPSVSADGKKMVYAVSSGRDHDIWYKDLESGQEKPLVTGKVAQNYPEISADGSSFTYHEVIPDPSDPVAYNHIAWRRPVDGGTPEKLCERCSYLGPAGTSGLCFDHDIKPGHIALLDASKNVRQPYLKHAPWEIMMPAPSPDGRWIAFTAKSSTGGVQVLVTKYALPSAPPSAEWKPIADGFMPVWSPDSQRLYFGSPRDGNLCLWSVRIDSRTGGPSGEPTAVSHLHGAARRLAPGVPVFRWISVARENIVFPLAETKGNIWLLR